MKKYYPLLSLVVATAMLLLPVLMLARPRRGAAATDTPAGNSSDNLVERVDTLGRQVAELTRRLDAIDASGKPTKADGASLAQTTAAPTPASDDPGSAAATGSRTRVPGLTIGGPPELPISVKIPAAAVKGAATSQARDADMDRVHRRLDELARQLDRALNAGSSVKPAANRDDAANQQPSIPTDADPATQGGSTARDSPPVAMALPAQAMVTAAPRSATSPTSPPAASPVLPQPSTPPPQTRSAQGQPIQINPVQNQPAQTKPARSKSGSTPAAARVAAAKGSSSKPSGRPDSAVGQGGAGETSGGSTIDDALRALKGDDSLNGESEAGAQAFAASVLRPLPGGRVAQTEDLVVATRETGWPVVLVRSDIDGDLWWAQQTVTRRGHYIGARVKFGNQHTVRGQVFELVLLLLETPEEAVRFKTARQFEKIPGGVRRSAIHRFTR